MIHARAILGPPESSDPEATWEPSPGNYWWVPKQALYPTTNRLLPGDIILFWPLKPDPVDREIIKYQSQRHPLKHASYTHAAVYIGADHLIAESRMFDGIVLNSIEDRVAANVSILVRRVTSATPLQREAIARCAVGFRGGRYDWKTILTAKFGDYKRRIRHNFADPEAERRLICSQLCHMAVARGAEVSLQPPSGELITPSVLSDSTELEDVKLDWTRVPSGDFQRSTGAF